MCLIPVLAVVACSDTGERTAVTFGEGCIEVPVVAPSTVPAGPQFCAVGRFLTDQEEVDPDGNYILVTVSWLDAKGHTVRVASAPPILDNVFDIGSAVKFGTGSEPEPCIASPEGFTSTDRDGRCRMLRKVGTVPGYAQFTIEVLDGDTVIDTIDVPISSSIT
ncbi:MAG: hypothetical protein RL238_2339 [Actinomycetota bacterium]